MSAPTSTSKRPAGPLLAILVLFLIAFAGGLAGVVMDRLVLLPRRFEGPAFEHGPGRHPPRDRDFRRRFAQEVGLSEQQQTRIDSIMDRQGRELRAVRRQVQPQVDSIVVRTRRELDSVLTPEQRQKAEEIRRRHPRPPGPPPENFPPEGRGGPPDGPPGTPPR
jgi:Spy/CpxP family protein refolding chaperone